MPTAEAVERAYGDAQRHAFDQGDESAALRYAALRSALRDWILQRGR